MISAAPITIYTCQEIFESLGTDLFPNGIKPKTVFQLPWPIAQVQKDISQQFLQNFDQQRKFEYLLEIRQELRKAITSAGRNPQPGSQQDHKGLELIVVVNQPDSDVATLFEMLEDDIESFFFDCNVQVMSQDEVTKIKKPLPQGYSQPIKNFAHQIDELGEVQIQVFKSTRIKCARCLKYKVERPKIKIDQRNLPILDKICAAC